MQNLTRVATEPPTTRCMTTSPGRSRAIPYLAAAYEVLADGSQEDPQRTSFDQAPGPGADFIRCSARPDLTAALDSALPQSRVYELGGDRYLMVFGELSGLGGKGDV